MKNNRLKIIAFSISIVLLLTIAPTFFGSAKKLDNKNNSNLITAENFKEIKPYIKRYSTNKFLESSFSSDEILVSNDIGNESHPSMAVSGEKVIVAYDYEYEGNESVCLKQSSDYGSTWAGTVREYKDTISPSFKEIKYGGVFFGTFLSTKNSSYVYEVSGSGNALEWDYSNITNETGKHIGSFFDFEKLDVCSYSDSTVNWIIGSIGDGEFIEEYEDYDCEDSPIFFYKDKEAEEPENSRIIVFFPEVSGCNNISIKSSVDSEENPMVYGVCEISNNSKNNLLFFHGNPEIWGIEDLLRKQTLTHSENLYHPQIFTDEDNIYIVAETESKEIKLFYSSNYGKENSWSIYNVTDEASSNPQIFVKNNNILCTFIQSNNLYKTLSENNGETWSEPEKVNSNNDSVVEGYKNTDIGDSDRIIWTDNRREDNTDLYMHLSYQPSVDLNLVNITLTKDRPFLPTNNYISVTIRNDGNVATTKDIPVNISYERENGNITYIKYPFVISEKLSPGEEVTRKRPMFKFSFPEYFMSFANFAGITNITVHIDPEQTIDDSNLDNNLKTIDVDYKDIFPRVGQNENLELIFQIIALLFELILS